jgi:hypothetical protein
MADELLLARLLGLGLITHQLVYLAEHGPSHFVDDFMPLLGRHLGPPLRIAASVGLSLASLGVVAFPIEPIARVAVVVLLLITMAYFPCRLSNHLPIAFCAALLLMIASVVPDPSSMHYGLAALVSAVYLMTGLHKLNRDYLSPRRSCGSWLARLWCEEKRISHGPIVGGLSLLAVFGVVFAELYLAGSFLPSVGPFPVALAVLIHTAFGLLCHVHFSMIMFSLLAPFIAVPSVPLPPLAYGVITGGALASIALGAYSPFRHPRFMAVLYAAFGAVCALLVFVVCSYGVVAAPIELELRPSSLWYFLPAGLLIFTSAGPYVGLKHEFSLAMFSSLRPDVSNHILFPQRRLRNRAIYVTFDSITGAVAVPERCSWRHAWVLRQLYRWETNKYSPYFVTEALDMIASRDLFARKLFRFSEDAAGIGWLRLTGRIGEQKFDDCSPDQLAQLLSLHPRRAFLPAVLPRDPTLPYLG